MTLTEDLLKENFRIHLSALCNKNWKATHPALSAFWETMMENEEGSGCLTETARLTEIARAGQRVFQDQAAFECALVFGNLHSRWHDPKAAMRNHDWAASFLHGPTLSRVSRLMRAYEQPYDDGKTETDEDFMADLQISFLAQPMARETLGRIAADAARKIPLHFAKARIRTNLLPLWKRVSAGQPVCRTAYGRTHFEEQIAECARTCPDFL